MSLSVNGVGESSGVAESTLTTRGDIFVRDASAVTRLALGSAGKVLRSDGTDLVYTTLTIPTTAARGTVLVASAANVVSALALGSAGKLLRSDGTDLIYTTATFPTTAARGTLLAATATDTVTALAASGADTFVGGDGTDVTTRTAAQARTSVQAAGRTIDPMTGSGWTSLTPASGSSTTWASSKLTLSIPTGVVVAQAAGVYDVDYLPDDERYDVMCRVDVVTGDTVSDGNFILWAGGDVGSLANQDGVLFILNSSGTIEALSKVNGSDTTFLTALAGPSAGERTGGNLWLRITRNPTALALHWGVGTAGAVPTSTQWTTVYAGSNLGALNASRGYGVRIDMYTFVPAGVTGGWVVDVLAIRASGQNSAPL